MSFGLLPTVKQDLIHGCFTVKDSWRVLASHHPSNGPQVAKLFKHIEYLHLYVLVLYFGSPSAIHLTPHLGGGVKHANVFMDTSHYFHVFIPRFAAFPHLKFSHIIAGKMNTIHKTKFCICPHGHIQNLTVSLPAAGLLQYVLPIPWKAAVCTL